MEKPEILTTTLRFFTYLTFVTLKMTGVEHIIPKGINQKTKSHSIFNCNPMGGGVPRACRCSSI